MINPTVPTFQETLSGPVLGTKSSDRARPARLSRGLNGMTTDCPDSVLPPGHWGETLSLSLEFMEAEIHVKVSSRDLNRVVIGLTKPGISQHKARNKGQ